MEDNQPFSEQGVEPDFDQIQEEKAGEKRRDNEEQSPPMIKEYNPLEENAKTRAAKRREELKKRKDKSPAVHQMGMKEDPRPWKGKPSSFFKLHVPKKGTYKLLNAEQKDFILIYYPDSVVDPVTLMEFLF